jgi:hypothetical protein
VDQGTSPDNPAYHRLPLGDEREPGPAFIHLVDGTLGWVRGAQPGGLPAIGRDGVLHTVIAGHAQAG